MTVNKNDIVEKFSSSGLKQGDIILVHSSLKSFGYVEGAQFSIIEGLMECIGNEGTLVVPTLTGKREDSRLNPPIFDVKNTPCWTGIIPETVRKMPNAVRSYHPTHSVAAIGHRKYEITEGHEYTKSPCDEKSPYFKIAKNGGYIILIGVDEESNTCIHSCEEISKVPYHLQSENTESIITGYNNDKIRIINKLHNWEKPATDFNKLDDIYYNKGIMNILKIGNAIIRIIDAKLMFEYTIEILKENPLFLLK